MLCAAWKGDEVAPLSPNQYDFMGGDGDGDDGGFVRFVSVCGCTPQKYPADNFAVADDEYLGGLHCRHGAIAASPIDTTT